ncbi:MAG: quinohemoprotein amine dehydrogenase subunit alpha [Gemmatimonadota bacterium]
MRTKFTCTILPRVVLLGAIALPVRLGAQTSPDERIPEGGIPIQDDAVVRSCRRCHAVSDDGRMSRISFSRKTPEGWELTLRRMVTLNEVDLEPAMARRILRYLSNQQGLAPEELRPVSYEVERRLDDREFADDLKPTCTGCHSAARALTQRRTREEWALLVAMHRGYYPLIDFQAFRRGGPAEEGEDPRHPMDKAIDHLAEGYPLETPEWTAWSASMRPPRLAGTWALSGNELGRGPLYGRVTVTPVAGAEDEFTTEVTYRYARDGKTVTRRGRATVYTGYQWRGRTGEGDEALREVMFVERDWQSMSGRWFTGAYDELGIDVELTRSDGPTVLGAWPRMLVSGRTGQTVEVHGTELPATLGTADVDLGAGVQVRALERLSAERVRIRVDVDADAAVGPRDLFVAGKNRAAALAVADGVDRIAVSPAWGMARLGGGNFPKGFQRFEALGYHNGPDGKPDTGDDVALGPVDVEWSLEEYSATLGDNDLAYVGALGADGTFTPALDGPNPQRPGNRNNVGDVWAVATYAPDGGRAPLRARAHLLVTVPLYMRWDPWTEGR